MVDLANADRISWLRSTGKAIKTIKASNLVRLKSTVAARRQSWVRAHNESTPLLPLEKGNFSRKQTTMSMYKAEASSAHFPAQTQTTERRSRNLRSAQSGIAIQHAHLPLSLLLSPLCLSCAHSLALSHWPRNDSSLRCLRTTLYPPPPPSSFCSSSGPKTIQRPA